MRVQNVMTKDVFTIKADEPISKAYDLMHIKKIRHLPVMEGDRVIGMLSERDARLLVLDPGMKVKDLASKKLHFVGPETSVRDAGRLMLLYKIGALPVLDEGKKLVGILTKSDLLAVFVDVFNYVNESNQIRMVLPSDSGVLESVIEDIQKGGNKLLGVSMSDADSEGFTEYIFRVQAVDLGVLKKRLTNFGYSLAVS